MCETYKQENYFKWQCDRDPYTMHFLLVLNEKASSTAPLPSNVITYKCEGGIATPHAANILPFSHINRYRV